MKFYLESVENTFKELSSDPHGLSAQEAEARLKKYGKNKLAEGKKVTLLQRFLEQLSDPMLIILMVAAVVSGITNYLSGESPVDVFIIMFVVILNSVLGVIQESKAEKAIEALKEMSAATSKVYRDGNLVTVKSEDLVPGDVIALEAGDAVPADSRIIECASLKVEEAALTGESVPVNKKVDTLSLGDQKDVPLGDRKNMLYNGTAVVYGRGKAVVVGTGMDTEMGKIATAITEASEGETPLQKKLSQLSKILTYMVLGICAFIFAFSVWRADAIDTRLVQESFMVAVSLAVAAIPEGLAAVVTIVLSIGVTKMSKRHAVIRKLTAVETLGCTEIICSDKTGTLTQNKMTVVDHFHFTKDRPYLAKAMSLCCDAEIDDNGNVTGEPTEAALVTYSYTVGNPKNKLVPEYPRIGEAPFDSVRKMMSTVHERLNKEYLKLPGVCDYVQFTKGAPGEVLNLCTHYLDENSVIKPLTDDKRELIQSHIRRMANNALRVLACAKREYEKPPTDFSPEALEHDLIFVGITGMIDPVRPEVVDAIKECHSAGIRPVMITGDHIDTAVAIAKQLGIVEDASQAITGAQLNEISEAEFNGGAVEKYSVYARVQPEHKVRIVKAWQARGKVTAMTGDGVNDAPSIKNADIGIGMGITGTDVTKNVADMVLADDNFATIVAAVEEGRRIYDNIRKSIQFLLSSNLSEVISIFVSTMMGFTILLPIHLLWINLITDAFPALALGMEKGEADIMKRKPRSSNEGIFAGGMGFDCAYQGIMLAGVTLVSYFVGHYLESGRWEVVDSLDGMTMAFITLAMAEIFHSFNMRTQHASIFSVQGHNVYLYGSMVFSWVLSTGIVYMPVISDMFKFQHISFEEYVVAMGMAFSVIPIVEIVKFIQRKMRHQA